MNNTANHIRRVYVDTSVVGGVFDADFGWQTGPFWDAVRNGEIVVIASDMLDEELKNAPIHVRKFFRTIPEAQIERVSATEESKQLAEMYVAENVVSKNCMNDCVHISIATIARADMLVSWNFKHIVNVNRVRGYNAVNAKLGYPQIDIQTPPEVLNDHR